MQKSFFLITVLASTLTLWDGTAGGQPYPGGLPQCQADLNTCNTSLTQTKGLLNTCNTNLNTCTTNLRTCQTDLAACEAEPPAVFPGDGVEGPALSYHDNGDGTVTDNNTLLMWEIKDTSGGIHDVHNIYTWSRTGSEGRDGTLFTVFLATLNTSPCFAGHCDWRVPDIKELHSIVDYSKSFPGPAIASNFPGATRAGNYWSSTAIAGNSSAAWFIAFDFGVVVGGGRVDALYVRAVRGGR